jgi:hypothetical protein
VPDVCPTCGGPALRQSQDRPRTHVDPENLPAVRSLAGDYRAQIDRQQQQIEVLKDRLRRMEAIREQAIVVHNVWAHRQPGDDTGLLDEAHQELDRLLYRPEE